MDFDFEWITNPQDSEPTAPVFDFLHKVADALAIKPEERFSAP